RIAPEEDRSCSQELLVRMLRRSDAHRIFITLCGALCGVRDIGLVILVEPLEKWVVGILQLVHGLTARGVADHPGIPIELYVIRGADGVQAQFESPEPVTIL